MDWKGIWIWENSHPQKDEYADFTQHFSLTAHSGPVFLEVSADSNYAAYINGQLAAFGQYHDFPHWKVADSHDITAFCREGDNELLITAWHWGETTFPTAPSLRGSCLNFAAAGTCWPLPVSTPSAAEILTTFPTGRR